jgi:hypothetical protein
MEGHSVLGHDDVFSRTSVLTVPDDVKKSFTRNVGTHLHVHHNKSQKTVMLIATAMLASHPVHISQFVTTYSAV